MPTLDNLQAAFAEESQANRKYLAFAAKADADGFPQIARLFRAAAAAESVHALAHLRIMKGVAEQMWMLTRLSEMARPWSCGRA